MIPGYEYIGKASYKGIEFIYVSSSVVGGKKIAEKEYINSNLQDIEELGLKQRSYSVEALVALLGDEPDYINKRDQILAALESPGPGILVHPIHGIIPNAVAKSWTLNENVSDIGIGSLQIEFGISNAQTSLIQDPLGSIALVQTNNIVKQSAETRTENTFKTGTKLLGVYASAKSKISSIGTKFIDVTRFVSKQADSVTEVITAPTDTLANVLGEFNSSVVKLANSPQQLAKSITNAFETINSTVATSSAGFEVFKNFFGFGWTDDIELRFNTVANRVKNNNNRLLNDNINGLALSYAYLNASRKNYDTTNEVDADVALLEDQYAAISVRPDIDPDFLDALSNTRATALEILSEARLRASAIVEVDLPLTSSRVISYRYYGDDSRAVDIANINSGNGLILEGNVKIFTK